MWENGSPFNNSTHTMSHRLLHYKYAKVLASFLITLYYQLTLSWRKSLLLNWVPQIAAKNILISKLLDCIIMHPSINFAIMQKYQLLLQPIMPCNLVFGHPIFFWTQCLHHQCRSVLLWWWRQHILYTRLHVVTVRKTTVWILITVKTSDIRVWFTAKSM